MKIVVKTSMLVRFTVRAALNELRLLHFQNILAHFKVLCFEESGGEGDADEKDSGQVGAEQLAHDPSFQNHDELDVGLTGLVVGVPNQHPLLDDVHCQLQLLLHRHILWKKAGRLDIKFTCHNPYAANLYHE